LLMTVLLNSRSGARKQQRMIRSILKWHLCITGTLALRLSAHSEQFDAPLPSHILLFTYGKAASTSVATSFGQLAHSSKIPSVDQFSNEYPPRCKIHKFSVARDYIDKLPSGSTAWIITQTRNRFARDIASYFQKFRHPEFESAMRNKTVPELQEDFRRGRDDYQDAWFHSQFLNATNVNLLAYAEQVKKDKYVHVEHVLEDKRLQILLVRFEDIDRWNEIFGVFFPGFALANENAVASGYEDKYVEFLNTYTFSEQEIKRTCHGDTMKFYSTSEISAMAPQCRNDGVQFLGANGQKVRNRFYVANGELLQYDVDLDLDNDS